MSGMPSAERKIGVGTARNEDFAEVSVLDTGTGIPPDKMKEVFEPFFTTKPHGMGMGLSICRSLIEAHIGRLAARSGGKQGAVFEITLPAGNLSQLMESA